MGLKWLVCWIGWTNYKGRETIKWVHRGVHGPDPGSWATVIASFAHSVAMLLLKRSVSGSWQPDLLMNLTSLSAWFPSSVSCVTNICICPGKVFCLSIFKPTSRPLLLLLLERAAQSFSLSVLSLLADSGTSSTKKQLSTVAATTPGSVPSEASVFPSWIRRLG